ncbi:hypothetical protein H4P12_08570 [Paracoccus sp. 11-3]|uniref:Flagellar assembly protein FliH n=1 Tax=Paracoccus amoyensis TaxID=2760093 RepID=A0A926GGA0_9RHOB|nr:hypothetical protein [Paracoccus amoyensis]MBC9246764.1 hypothetical protein [Paracoccus amoyensis]
MFKLESFTTALTHQGTVVSFSRDDVDQAYADGLAAGLSRKEDADIRSLSAGLEQLQRCLQDDQARRAKLRQEAIDALAPILEQILECLLPCETSQRLEDALKDELLRLSHSATPLRAVISCNTRLRETVEHCLADAGINDVEPVEVDSDKITLSLQGGRIELSPENIATDIRRMISELKAEDSTWTH